MERMRYSSAQMFRAILVAILGLCFIVPLVLVYQMEYISGVGVSILSLSVLIYLSLVCSSLHLSEPRSPSCFHKAKTRMCTAQDLDLLRGVLSDHPSNMLAEWRCTICLCDSHGDGQQLRELELCKHVFHRDCIDQWFLDTPLFSLKCPLCRGPVFKPETPEIEVPSPVSAGRPHFVDRNDIGLPGA